MNTSGLKDKITGALKGFSIEKALHFVKKNVRYFTAGALFVILVLILANCTDTSEQKGMDGTEIATESTVVVEYEVDAYPEINELITNYYAAYAAGDIDQIKKYATPVTETEGSYIQMFSEYVDSYENVVCYTKPGADDKSHLVSAYFEIKFQGVDTLAPGLDFFYVTENEDGEVYIDNLYSSFNRSNGERELDTSIQKLINSFELNEDAVRLQIEVQQKFESAMSSDETLAEMVNVTIKEASAAWRQDLAQQQAEANQSTESDTEQTQEPAETETPSEIVYALNTVNIRAKADQDAELVDTVAEGTALTRIGTTDNGWSIIEYDNKECYVKSDYLSTEAPQKTEEPEETAADPNGIAEGTEIVLSNSVNVRASMDSSAQKLGTAYVGEKVTVVMSYAEGWTKVNWKGQTGYIKTEYLK